MGYYINPPDMSKEAWLRQNGKPIEPRVFLPDFNYEGDSLPVCLVDNGMFTAAAIAYSRDEAAAFNYPGDDRPKHWYIVPKAALTPWYPLKKKT